MIDRFSKLEFEAALPTDKDTGASLWTYYAFDKGEHTYLVPLEGRRIAVLIRSSIEMTGRAAPTGNDSIRLVLINSLTGQPLAKKVDAWTQRTYGWQDRMLTKISTLYQKGLSMVNCPQCDTGVLYKRDGKFGVFYGCSNYPRCKYTTNSLANLKTKAVKPETVINEPDDTLDFGAVFESLSDDDFNFEDCDDYSEEPITDTPAIRLNAQQVAFVTAPIDANIRVMAAPGAGKCLAPGTKILLYSGEIINVEDIEVGMLIMGPDSNPKTVLSLGHGYEDMYEIVPVKGEPFVVNESHILSLNSSGDKKLGTGTIVNISLRDYFSLNKTKKHHLKLWRTGADFDSRFEVDLDPYILGCWLGDGASATTVITTTEDEVLGAFRKFAEQNGLYLRSSKSDPITYRLSSKKWHDNAFLNLLRSYNLIGNKHVPFEYKTATRAIRLEVLAGLIDTDGYYGTGYYDYISKGIELASDVVFIARSLGFAAYMTAVEKCCMYLGEKKCGIYYRVSISGDLEKIPTRVERRKASRRMQKKRVTVTGFSVNPVGYGEYYGFTVNGDGLFLLGDFTVTHNTFASVERIAHLIESGIDPNKIVYVTFTKSMATEGYDRISRRVPEVATSNLSKQVCTIHALCFRILRWEGMKRDVPKEWQVKQALNDIIAGDDRKHISGEWQHTIDKPGYKEVLYWIDNAKSRGITSENDLRFFIAHMPHDQAKKVHNARKRFDNWLNTKNYITFADMPYLVEQRLQSDTAFRNKYQKRFSHIILDEAQDSSEISMSILLTLSLEPGNEFISFRDRE